MLIVGCNLAFMVQSPQISWRSKVGLLIIAWGTAAVAMTVAEPICWRSLWFFPFYTPPVILAGWMGLPQLRNVAVWHGVLAIGWLYYVVLSLWALRVVRRRVFYWAFAILCVSLVLNCAGCRAAFHTGPSHILMLPSPAAPADGGRGVLFAFDAQWPAAAEPRR